MVKPETNDAALWEGTRVTVVSGGYVMPPEMLAQASGASGLGVEGLFHVLGVETIWVSN